MGCSKSAWNMAAVGTSLVLVAVPGAAGAADPARGDAADSVALAEVVVTARKREERLQDVPMAVAAYSAAVLESARVTNLEDYLKLSSALRFDATGAPHQAIIQLRGIGGLASPLVDRSVGFFVDGVPLAADGFLTTSLLDAARVEVLKGPQSTLFGKGTIAGAISVTTNPPGDALNGNVRLRYTADDDRKNASAAIGGPLAGDRLGFRLAVSADDKRGYFRNQANTAYAYVDSREEVAARLKLVGKVTDALTVEFDAFKLDHSSDPFTYGLVNGPDDERPVFERNSRQLYVDVDASAYAIRGVYDAAAFSVTSISAVSNSEDRLYSELDYDAIGEEDFAYATDKDELSQEIRLASTSAHGPRWQVGAFFGRTTTEYFNELVNFEVAPGFSIPSIVTADSTTRNRNSAVFGDVSFDLTERTKLDLGLRRSWDVSKQDDFLGGEFDRRSSLSFWAYSTSLSWRFSPDHMVYGRVASTKRPGGFNPSGPNFDEESLRTWELGVKSSAMGGYAVVNVALFLNEYEAIQTFAFDERANQAIRNTGDADISGVELEFSYDAAEGFAISGAANYYFDVSYSSYSALLFRPDFSFGLTELSGNRIRGRSKYVYLVAPQYSVLIGHEQDPLRLTARAEARAEGGYFGDDFEFAYLRSRRNLNLSIALSRGAWEGQVFVENVTDEKYLVNYNSFFQFPFTAGKPLGVLTSPRTVGAAVSYRF